MLALVGSHYHYRRAVPARLREAIGQREVWLALKTTSRRRARNIAGVLHGETERLFHAAGAGQLPEKFDLRGYLRRMVDIHPSDFESHRDHVSANIGVGRDFLTSGNQSIIRRFLSDIDTRDAIMRSEIKSLRHELDVARASGNREHERELVGLLDRALALSETLASRTPAPVSPPAIRDDTPISEPAPPQPPRPAEPRMLISKVVERHLVEKRKKAKDITSYNKLVKVTNKALSLFVECFGDMDVRDITGSIVGDFKDALSNLHVNHGRDRKGLSIQEEIDRTFTEDLEPLAQRTVKNHLGALSPAWRDIVNRELVPRNPWLGWSFDLTQKVIRRAWSEDELLKLSGSEWTTSVVSRRTYAGMVMMALYTGMRAGEIAYLRNDDIAMVDGILCFVVREHIEQGQRTALWKPKTKAGTRNVPIHSALLNWGILDYQKAGEEYLFHELSGDTDRSRGQSFSQEFSKHKAKIGMPLAVTFHGFRHTVSTHLRNVRSDIREIWIDAMLGHESSHKSMGAIGYTKIHTTNIRDVVELIHYPNNIHIPR